MNICQDRRWLSTAICIATSLLAVGAFAKSGAKFSPEAEARAQKLIGELMERKRHRNAAQQKMDSGLIDQMSISRGKWLTKSIKKISTGIAVDTDGRVVVELAAKVTPSLLDALRARRSDLLSVVPRFDSVLIRTPLQGLEEIAMLPGVRFVNREPVAKTNTITSKGDKKHQALLTRSTYGLSGNGVKVGVLSDSVDGLTNSILAGELPPDTTWLTGQEGTGIGEGTAMMEIIHDLAPGSQLLFATAKPSQAQMAANILALSDAGCSVIVDDFTFFAEPAFQDGPISQAINTVANNGGICVSSAGNYGRLTAGTSSVWEGDFQPRPFGDPSYHAFGLVNANQILTSSGTATLQWSDALGASFNDYDLYVFEPLGDVYSASTSTQNGSQDPLEFCNTIAGKYILVVKYQGSERYLRVSTHGGRLQYATAGQTAGHNAAEKVISVGATDANVNFPTPFSSSSPIETFSSDGPRHIFYNPDGSPITPGSFRATGGRILQKPDVVGADGVATSVPGFGSFYGTSASAPHVAAIAALIREANPTVSADNMRILCQFTSTDIGGTGWDRDSGFGAMNALPAVQFAIVADTKISFASPSIESGRSMTCTLTLPNALAKALTFNISVDLSGTVAPTSVTVPANNASVNFTVTPPVNDTGSNRTITVSATLPATGGTKQSSFIQTIPAELDYVLVSPDPVHAGDQLTCTISLTAVAGSNKIVTMTSSDPYVVPIPASISVATGTDTRTFKVTTRGVSADKEITLSFSLQDRTVSDSIMVKKGVLTTVSLNPAAVSGGSSSTGTAVLDGVAPPGGFVVTLAAAEPAVIGVPASVTIPEGARSAPFPITTKPVLVNKGYGIFCRLTGVLVRPFLRVNAPKISALNLSPTSVKGGANSTGFIGITSPAPAGGFKITLTSDKAQASVPATVTVLAGETGTTFPITTSPVTASVLATISASKTGSVTKTKGLRITP